MSLRAYQSKVVFDADLCGCPFGSYSSLAQLIGGDAKSGYEAQRSTNYRQRLHFLVKDDYVCQEAVDDESEAEETCKTRFFVLGR